MAAMPKSAVGKSLSGKSVGGTSILSTAIVLALLTVLAGGVGFLGGHQLKQSIAKPQERASPTVTEARIDKESVLQLLPLPAIVTNLEAGGWVRLEASVLLADDQTSPPSLAPLLADDISVLLRTLTLSQISGASGFHHLREDIIDRLRTRTKSRARDVLIQSMVIE